MSRLNKELRSLFIHVPKAAGSSLSSPAWNRGNGHDTVADFDHRIELSPDLWVWAFVRNPFERIASAYEDCPEVFDDCPTFDSFIERIWNHRENLEEMTFARWAGNHRLGLPVGRIHFLPQELLLMDLRGRFRPDFVGRFEKLQADFDRIADYLGQTRETLPHKNSREGKHQRRFTPLRDLYKSKTTRARVEEIYRRDLERWNYQLEL